MTTIPLPPNQRSKSRAESRSALGRILLVGLVILLGAWGTAAAETYDAGEQLYRRGYPKEVDLEWAVSDYNAVHRANAVAKNYPELDIAELLPAISRAIAEMPRKDKFRLAKLAKLAALKKSVLNGKLPAGSILTFQYHSKNRTPYWFQWGALSEYFSIFLLAGLDENPPETETYNEKAILIGVLIRSHKRGDQEWKDSRKR